MRDITTHEVACYNYSVFEDELMASDDNISINVYTGDTMNIHPMHEFARGLR